MRGVSTFKAFSRRLGVIVMALALAFTALSAAAQTHRGKTLTVLVTPGFLSKAWHTQAQEWAAQEGATVRVIEVADSELYEHMMTELITGSGAYDIVQYPPYWNGDVMPAGLLRPLDAFIEAGDIDWDDYLPVFRDNLSAWGGVTYGVQIDGDVFVLAYRKDLFEDPKEQAAFKDRYGYELTVPETWSQFLDVAEFFTRDTDGDGVVDFWGTADIARRGAVSMWHFFARLAAYLDSPHVYAGGIYFDPDTMQPLIDSPAGVRALEEFVASTEPNRSPPGIQSYDWSDVWNAFVSGQVAMVFAWPDLGPLSIDPAYSKIIGKAGFARLPGSYEVWNTETGRWEQREEAHAASPLAWGWTLGITSTSRNPDAAYDLIEYMVTGERSIEHAIWSDDGFDPYRRSQFADPRVAEAYSQIPEFMPALLANIEVGIPDLRIPGTREYYDAIELHISRALQREVTPEEALRAAARDWNNITNRRGLANQLRAYRDSLGLD